MEHIQLEPVDFILKEDEVIVKCKVSVANKYSYDGQQWRILKRIKEI